MRDVKGRCTRRNNFVYIHLTSRRLRCQPLRPYAAVLTGWMVAAALGSNVE